MESKGGSSIEFEDGGFLRFLFFFELKKALFFEDFFSLFSLFNTIRHYFGNISKLESLISNLEVTISEMEIKKSCNIKTKKYFFFRIGFVK